MKWFNHGAGGIQRYMEAFPAGGYFAGRNFVFDERVTVAGGSGQVVGRCCLCEQPHDTYEPRCRCSHCRMLVLVCPTCAPHVRTLPFGLQSFNSLSTTVGSDRMLLWSASSPFFNLEHARCGECSSAAIVAWHGIDGKYCFAQGRHHDDVLCELCHRRTQTEAIQNGYSAACSSSRQHGGEGPACPAEKRCSTSCQERSHATPKQPGMVSLRSELQPSPGRRLRILCLHGFRQNAHTFKGRNAGLIRRLSGIAELVCVDAPHKLAFLMKGSPQATSSSLEVHPTDDSAKSDLGDGQFESCSGRDQSPHENNAHHSGSLESHQQQRHPRRGWLVEPGQLAADRVRPFRMCFTFIRACWLELNEIGGKMSASTMFRSGALCRHRQRGSLAALCQPWMRGSTCGKQRAGRSPGNICSRCYAVTGPLTASWAIPRCAQAFSTSY